MEAVKPGHIVETSVSLQRINLFQSETCSERGDLVRGSWFSSRSLVKSQEEKKDCFYRFNAYGFAGEQIIDPARLGQEWLERPELGVRFDMQLTVIHDIVLAHDLSWDPSALTLAENNILVRLPDNVVPGDITTWTAVFLTCTLAVLEVDDEYTDQSYILDVIKVDAMYKNMD
ncbi:hypothetical protein B0H13DRAFT_2555731 [Mycena leptocephala]|nr:hypothetical protein B0H13DRAFT_2555731 [Mycena leptocephala]